MMPVFSCLTATTPINAAGRTILPFTTSPDIQPIRGYLGTFEVQFTALAGGALNCSIALCRFNSGDQRITPFRSYLIDVTAPGVLTGSIADTLSWMPYTKGPTDDGICIALRLDAGTASAFARLTGAREQ